MKKFLLFFLYLHAMMYAEVENVVIRWNAALCLSTCIPLMERNLRSALGVADVAINPFAGTAELKWDPQIPFSYYPINLAVRSTGLGLIDVRLKVRGLISRQGSTFYIMSLGDGSRFLILGRLQPVPGGFTPDSIGSYGVPPPMVAQLLDAEARRQIVTMTGVLFQPGRYSLAHVVEQLNVPPPKPAAPNVYLRP